MKKLICFLLSCLILFLCTACQFSLTDGETTDSNSENGFWVRSESYFVGYTVSGDKIQFRYSFCFQNLSEYDLKADAFVVSFRKRDLKNWLMYEQNFIGELISGDKDVLIPSGEKVNVILVFEGEYLGGEVNEEVYIKRITMCQRIVEGR